MYEWVKLTEGFVERSQNLTLYTTVDYYVNDEDKLHYHIYNFNNVL